MIKKSMVIVTILMFIFLVGCLDYKAYDTTTTETSGDSLVDEIAQIEAELGLTGDTPETNGETLEKGVPGEGTIGDDEEPLDEIVEEIILPELEEEDIFSEEAVIVTVKENDLVKLSVKVADPDQDVVTYTFSKPLDKNGQWKTNYGDAGEYFITITATDGLLSTEKNVKIIVERVNVAPVIKMLSDITVKEGKTVEFEPTVTDPNNDPITVTVSEPLKEGIFKTDHTSAGEYQIRVTATDGELASEDSFKLTIVDVNVLPLIEGVKDITVKEGEIVILKPVISDLDEDEITVTITEPVGDDGVWQTSFTDHGEYLITITADDGKDKVRKKINLTVEDVNMPPEIVEVSLTP